VQQLVKKITVERKFYGYFVCYNNVIFKRIIGDNYMYESYTNALFDSVRLSNLLRYILSIIRVSRLESDPCRLCVDL